MTDVLARLLFTSTRSDDVAQVFLTAPDGAMQTQYTTNPQVNRTAPRRRQT